MGLILVNVVKLILLMWVRLILTPYPLHQDGADAVISPCDAVAVISVVVASVEELSVLPSDDDYLSAVGNELTAYVVVGDACKCLDVSA